MYLFNTSTQKAFKVDGFIRRNIAVKSMICDIGYLKKITLKEIKNLGIELVKDNYILKRKTK